MTMNLQTISLSNTYTSLETDVEAEDRGSLPEHKFECPEKPMLYMVIHAKPDPGEFIRNALHMHTTDPDCAAIRQSWSNDLVVEPHYDLKS